MGLVNFYLILYNALCCVGWAGVWTVGVQSLFTSLSQDKLSITEALSSMYASGHMAMLLSASQSIALLEIVHSAIGFVRSPVTVVFMQVMSRIVALVAIYYSKDAQSTYLSKTLQIFVHLIELLTTHTKF